MDPLIGSALIGAGSSILGNIFGFGSNNSANETNLKIAQMNNDFNREMLDKQLAYNQDMFNQQVEYDQKKMQQQNSFNYMMQNNAMASQQNYNSAKQQRARLEAAGLNPYVMMSGGSAGTSSVASGSAGSGGSPSPMGVNPPTASQVQVRPYDFDFTGIGGVIQTLLDIQAQKGVRDATANQLNIENKYLADEIISRIDLNKSERFFKDSAERLNNMTFAQMQALLPYNINKAAREAENAAYTGMLIKAQTAWQQIQGKLGQKELAVFDQKFLQEMSIMAAQQYQLVAAGKASEAQAKQAIESAFNLTLQREGIKTDNYIKEKTKQALIDTARYNSSDAYWKSVGSMNNSGPRDAWQSISNDIRNGHKTAPFFRGIQNVLGSLGSWFPKF